MLRNPSHNARPDARDAAGWSVGLGLAAFLLYAALAPVVPGKGDSSEFVLALAIAGVPHPTGYPLYVLIGHLWVGALHGWGMDWARAANLWSALGGAVAVGLVHALGVRVARSEPRLSPGARARVALVPALLIALNPLFLTEASQAEVNSWHFAIVVGVLLAGLAAHRRIAAAAPLPRGTLLAGSAAWGLACGVGLAHHLTSIFFTGPLSLLLLLGLIRSRRLTALVPVAFLGGAMVALSSYGFLFWRARHPAAYQWPLLEPTAASVLDHARGGVFKVFLGGFHPLPEQSAMLARTIYPFLAVGLPALAWAVWRVQTDRAFLLALLAAALLQLMFVLHYGVQDPAVYFFPALMAGMIGLGVAIAPVAARLPHPAAAAPVALGIVLAGAIWVGAAARESAQLVDIERLVHARWRAIPFERGVVLWNNDFFCFLKGYQILDGESPGRYVENPAMLTWAPPRRAFEKRFGFDPLSGLELREDADLVLIAPNIARLGGMPVVDFDRFTP